MAHTGITVVLLGIIIIEALNIHIPGFICVYPACWAIHTCIPNDSHNLLTIHNHLITLLDIVLLIKWVYAICTI